jgi:hypothetical protein
LREHREAAELKKMILYEPFLKAKLLLIYMSNSTILDIVFETFAKQNNELLTKFYVKISKKDNKSRSGLVWRSLAVGVGANKLQ